jgi:2,3-dihydroxyethylbenzene 1,2-dioxygenase
MPKVTELGYVGLSISNLNQWKAYACEVAGMEFVDEGEKDRAYLRMDEWHHRIVLHADGGDDIAYLGLRVPGPIEFKTMAEKLESAGITLRHGSDAEANERRVMALLKMRDPGGNQVEIFWGPQTDRHKPFHPGRPMFGRFVTGDQGLGHLVLGQPDPEAAIRFYETLGFVGAAGMKIALPGGIVAKPIFMHINGRQHSIAFAPAPEGKRLHHMMFEYTELKDLGIAHDLVRARQIPVAMQLGMHANDEQLSFYSATPSGFTWELGWGGRQASAQLDYHTRDVFGHAPEAKGYALDLPLNG